MTAAAHPAPPPSGSGDAWVVAESGERYWGRFGAAGLLAIDPERGVLLQQRAQWSHHGGTWGIPGGARHAGESAIAGALRESAEEAGVPVEAVRPRFVSVVDLGIWSYSTIVADVLTPFEPVIADPESLALEWVPVDAVADLPLHPGFAASWPSLRPVLGVRPRVVVDGANVVGSVPDGWWRDRAGAATRLVERIDRLAVVGVGPAALGAIGLAVETPGRWSPEWVVVLEGAAAGVDGTAEVAAVRAPGAGDDTIVAEARRATADGRTAIVVTSDRALADRARAAGAEVRPVSWLHALLDDGSSTP